MFLFTFATLAASRAVQTPLQFISAVNTSESSKVLSHQFLHLTDLHIDKYYVESGSFESQCHERDYKQEAGRFGTPKSNCDSPMSLIKLSFDFIQSYHTKNNLDFVLWTGDNARHDNDFRLPRTEDEVFQANKLAKKLMIDAFGYKIPIVPTLGNNDVSPHNALHYQEKNYVLKTYSKIWKDFIPKSQIRTFLKHGSFAVDVVSKRIRILSVNTLYLSNSNRHITDCSKHKPKHASLAGDVILEWMQKELIRAKNDKVKVYIMGHHPPNIRNYGPHCTKRVTKLAIKFRTVIKAQFYGHMNLDHFFFPVLKKEHLPAFHQLAPRWIKKYFESLMKHFKLVNRVKTNVGSPIFVSPSLTSVFNPGIRVYEYSTAKHYMAEITNYHQYFLNLVEWNSRKKKDKKQPPVWELEYSAKSEYQMDDLKYLDLQAWMRLAGQIASGKGKTRQSFKENLVARTNENLDL